MIDKAPDAFRTISEAAEDLGLPQHVLRFWETRFTQIKPLKRGGGRRYYRPDDIEFLRGLKQLLHAERYTIKGVQKIIKEQGIKSVQRLGRGDQPAEPTRVAPASPQVYERPRTAVAPFVRARAPLGMRGKLEAALAELTDCQRLLTILHQG
jgi:DNA-binding transcriptional MerR regulator